MISCLSCLAAWETNKQPHTTEGFLVLYHKENTIDTLYQELPISVAITFIWNLCPQETGQVTMIVCSFPVTQSQWTQHRGTAYVIQMPQVASYLEGREKKINALALLRPLQCPGILECHSLCLSNPFCDLSLLSKMQLFPRWSLEGVYHLHRNTTE